MPEFNRINRNTLTGQLRQFISHIDKASSTIAQLPVEEQLYWKQLRQRLIAWFAIEKKKRVRQRMDISSSIDAVHLHAEDRLVVDPLGGDPNLGIIDQPWQLMPWLNSTEG